MSITFQTDRVSLTLPDGWADNSSPDAISFINKATLEELTIGLWETQQPIAFAELATHANHLLEMEAKALVRMSHSQVDILDASESTTESPCVVRFTAFSKAAQAYCSAVVVGYPTHFVGVTYYRHSCAEPTAGVAERAMDIVARVAVREH